MSPRPYKRTLYTISEKRREKITAVIHRRQNDLTIVLENIWDPHNVGAILRSADAAGVHTVHFLYYIEQAPNLRKIGKLSSASANKWLNVVNHHDVDSCFASLRTDGYSILASHLERKASSLYSFDLTQKTALVFGNEHRGVSTEALVRADGVFFIPMMGMVQSLNASVAAGVTLYEACRQRILSGGYTRPTFDEAAMDELLVQWGSR